MINLNRGMKHTHQHHILPKHAGGTDDPSNFVELTVEEHAEAHRVLWETFGRWQDKLAWETLTGRITKEDAVRLAASKANRGQRRSQSTEFKKGSNVGKEYRFQKGTLPKSTDMIFITNGEDNKIHDPRLPIPDGWVQGQTKAGYTNNGQTGKHTRTPETISKFVKNRTGKGTGSRNAMALQSNRDKVAASKRGRKRVYHADGSFTMSKVM